MTRKALGCLEQLHDLSLGDTLTMGSLDSKLLGAGPLKNVFGDQEGFDAKMNVAMSGEGGELVVGRGAGGMGMRGTGKGGGGEGFGRVGGLGKVDTGGGKGMGGKVGKAKKKKKGDTSTVVEEVVQPFAGLPLMIARYQMAVRAAPATDSSQSAFMTIILAMSLPCSPMGVTQPMTTSST